MPLSEDATLYIRIWTGQKCKACGSAFSYVRRFAVPRSQTEFNATQESVETAYVKAAKTTSEVVFPCPHCGYIQPDMASTRKAVSHGVFTFACFFLLLIGTMTSAFGILPKPIAATIAAGIAGIAVLFHFVQVFSNPNRNRIANMAQAILQVQKGALRLTKIGGEAVLPSLVKPMKNYVAAGGILLVAAAAFIAPVLATDLPFWLCQVAGIALFIWSGSTFANAALKLKRDANPREVIEVNTTQVLDESVPEDFRKKT
jgi:hypothetical protein